MLEHLNISTQTSVIPTSSTSLMTDRVLLSSGWCVFPRSLLMCFYGGKLKTVFQKKQVSNQEIKIHSIAGILITTAIIGIWATSLVLLLSIDIAKSNLLLLFAATLWQTFLYTGLFITAHDAMHGVVFPGNNKMNHFIGSLCLVLYGSLPYKKLLKKHHVHHHRPASELDPDFHDGKYKNFFAWYIHFMKRYWSWWQIISLTIIYNFAHYILHIPQANLTVFWAIPALLSSLQLFYFGTFLPHREPEGGYSEPHRAKSTSYPVWLSFITCYHFGYHEEHHEYPHLPWWQLPEIYQYKIFPVRG